MSKYRFGVTASVIAALLASAAPMPAAAGYSMPGIWGGPAPAAPPAKPSGWGATDKLREAIRLGMLHMATVFTTAGCAIISNRVIQAGTAPKNIGWGIGTNAAATGDTTLQTESAPTTAGGRTVGTESRTTVTNTNDNYQVLGTVTSGSTLAITEMGTFDNVTAGNLNIRSVFAAVNVVSGDSIAGTFGLKFVPG